MTSLSIVAPDTTQALEEVSRRLGADAYILSTTHVNGQVEVKATNDPIPSTSRPGSSARKSFAQLLEQMAEKQMVSVKPGQNRNKSFTPQAIVKPKPATSEAAPEAPMHSPLLNNASREVEDKVTLSAESIAKSQAVSPKAPSLDEVQETLTNLIRKLETSAGETTSQPAPELTGTEKDLVRAGVSRQLIANLRASFEGQTVQQGTEAFFRAVAKLVASEHPETTLRARNIMIAGPSGSGRTLVAAKIAARLMETNPESRPLLIAPRTEGYNDGQALRSLSRVLGVDHVHADADSVPLINRGRGAFVFDLPADTKAAKRLIHDVQCENKAEDLQVILVIPAGASRLQMERLLQAYGEYKPVVLLTRMDECDLAAPEISVIAEHNAKIAWTTGTKGLVDSLTPASQLTLAHAFTKHLKNPAQA